MLLSRSEDNEASVPAAVWVGAGTGTEALAVSVAAGDDGAEATEGTEVSEKGRVGMLAVFLLWLTMYLTFSGESLRKNSC